MTGKVDEGETSGTCEDGVLLRFIGEEVGIGLDMVTDAEPDTVAGMLAVVVLMAEVNA